MSMNAVELTYKTILVRLQQLINLKGDYTLLSSNFVLDVTFKQIH